MLKNISKFFFRKKQESGSKEILIKNIKIGDLIKNMEVINIKRENRRFSNISNSWKLNIKVIYFSFKKFPFVRVLGSNDGIHIYTSELYLPASCCGLTPELYYPCNHIDDYEFKCDICGIKDGGIDNFNHKVRQKDLLVGGVTKSNVVMYISHFQDIKKLYS